MFFLITINVHCNPKIYNGKKCFYLLHLFVMYSNNCLITLCLIRFSNALFSLRGHIIFDINFFNQDYLNRQWLIIYLQLISFFIVSEFVNLHFLRKPEMMLCFRKPVFSGNTLKLYLEAETSIEREILDCLSDRSQLYTKNVYEIKRNIKKL